MKNKINTITSTLLASSLLLSTVNFAFATDVNGYSELQGDYESSEIASFSEAELAQILAPVALYPDSLLAHILVAASYPLDVVQAHRFVQDNQGLSAQALMDEAESMNWDPSIVALLGFPDVLEQMNDELDWTVSVGTAFISDEAAVLASIQTLRQDAQAANSLQNLAHMKVTNVNNHIYIAPRHQQKVYVPVYNPQYVYGNWRYRSHRPFTWNATLRLNLSPGIRISWGSRIGVNFDFFFGAFHWGNRHTVFTNHRGSKRFVNPYAISRNKYAKPYRFSAQRLKHNHRKVYVKRTGKQERYTVSNAKRHNKQVKAKHSSQFERSRNNQARVSKELNRQKQSNRSDKNGLLRVNSLKQKHAQQQYAQTKNVQQKLKRNTDNGQRKASAKGSQNYSKGVVSQKRTVESKNGKQTTVKQKTVITQKRTINKGASQQKTVKRQQGSQQRASKQQNRTSSKAQRSSSNGKNKKQQ